MKNVEIEELIDHLAKTQPDCHACLKVRDLGLQAIELQAFIVDLTNHYASPGPTPEKTAEHYQLVHRAKALRALI